MKCFHVGIGSDYRRTECPQTRTSVFCLRARVSPTLAACGTERHYNGCYMTCIADVIVARYTLLAGSSTSIVIVFIRTNFRLNTYLYDNLELNRHSNYVCFLNNYGLSLLNVFYRHLSIYVDLILVPC